MTHIACTGFHMEQIDPLEAKCEELKKILKMAQPRIMDDEIISEYMTRENLLSFCQSYGTKFQRHYPIIHMSSFKVTETEPILLLVVMLAGACGSDAKFASNYLMNVATQILVLIQNQEVSSLEICLFDHL